MTNKFANKHQNPALPRKILLLILSLFLIIFAYPCLSSNLPKEFNFPCIFFETTWFSYILASCVVVLFLITFIADNWKKLPYYLSEFLLIIFGIYGITIIQKAIQNQVSLKFTIFNLVLIFIIAAILLDFKELFEDLLEEDEKK